MRLFLALFSVFICMLVAPAHADDLRPGYLEWREGAPGQWQVVWKAPLLGGLATRAKPLLPQGCTAGQAARRFAGPAMIETFAVRCDTTLAGRELGLTGLESGFTDALLRVAPLGRPVQVARLTPSQPLAMVAAQAPRGEVWATYFRLGVSHILFGFDHLLFVVGLVLLIRRARQLVATATAFTLAHSLTLAATTLGLLVVARKPVEVCIALSIVFLAREIVRDRDSFARRAPAAVAFVFGLLHGFGFAAALAEIGLPAREIPSALLAFNLGVEAGQLLIVAAALAVLSLIARLGWLARAKLGGAYAIGAVASAWLIERALA
jgi:hydrogenase/urease accessory protein HupE